MAADTETLTAPALTPETLAELEAMTRGRRGYTIRESIELCRHVPALIAAARRAMADAEVLAVETACEDTRELLALTDKYHDEWDATVARAEKAEAERDALMATVDLLSPLGKTNEYRRILDLTDERDILAGKLKKAEERDAGQGQELMNLSETLHAARAERDAYQKGLRETAMERDSIREKYSLLESGVMDDTREIEHLTAERDAALKRATDAEKAIRQAIEDQTKHLGQVTACAVAGSILHRGESDCTEGVIKGLEFALEALQPGAAS